MNAQDIRWIQRFIHFNNAFAQITEAIELARQRPLSKLEGQGLIQAFEYTHELAWNTLKDFVESRGAHNLYGSKDVTREAFKIGLLENGETWMDMIHDRNLTSHTYNENTAKAIVSTRPYHFQMHAISKQVGLDCSCLAMLITSQGKRPICSSLRA